MNYSSALFVYWLSLITNRNIGLNGYLECNLDINEIASSKQFVETNLCRQDIAKAYSRIMLACD